MRTTDRTAVSLFQNLVKGDRDAERIQLLDNVLRAFISERAQLGQLALQSFNASEMEREEMDFVLILKCAQLTAGDDADAEPITRCACGGDAGDAVVIG